jgi:hypothetical protein
MEPAGRTFPVEEAPTRNQDAVEVGPDQQRAGKQWAQAVLSCSAEGAAQHSIWGFPLIVASSCVGLEGEVLVKRQQHTLLVATLAQLEPRSQARSGAQPRPDTDTSRDTSSSRPTAGEV